MVIHYVILMELIVDAFMFETKQYKLNNKSIMEMIREIS